MIENRKMYRYWYRYEYSVVYVYVYGHGPRPRDGARLAAARAYPRQPTWRALTGDRLIIARVCFTRSEERSTIFNRFRVRTHCANIRAIRPLFIALGVRLPSWLARSLYVYICIYVCSVLPVCAATHWHRQCASRYTRAKNIFFFLYYFYILGVNYPHNILYLRAWRFLRPKEITKNKNKNMFIPTSSRSGVWRRSDWGDMRIL